MGKIIPISDNSDKSTDTVQVAEQHKTQLFHQQPFYKGHTLFEVDIDAETVRKMPIEKIAVVGKRALPKQSIMTHNKVVTKPNCLYISCLNIKNLQRLIINAGGKDISSYKFID